MGGRGRQLGEPAPPDSSDGPVFVDESGRRSKTYRRLGWVVASLCAAYAVTLVFAVLGGNATAPWLPLTGPKEEAKVEEAEVLPGPDGTPGPAAGSDGTPDPEGSATPPPEASGGATASPGSVLVPAGRTGLPTASASPTPSAGSSGTGGAAATEPAPSASAAKPSSASPTQPTPVPEPPVESEPPAASPEPPVQEEGSP